jgi:hypothetical protein
MRKNGNYRSVIFQFSIVVLCNVVGYLTLNRVIPDSTHHLPMQAYLLFVPGILKIRDALDIWLSPGNEMRGWVYVDQSFYRMKAIDGFIFKRLKSVS